MTRLTKRDTLGSLLLFSSGFVLIFAGLRLASNWLVKFSLAEAISQYLGLTATPSTEVQRFAFSLPAILIMAGAAVILGTAIWCASPRRPHRGTDLTIATGKIVISFGASIATLPLATMLFGVWATLVLSVGGFPTTWLVFLLPSLGLQLAAIILTGAGSILFAGFRPDSQYAAGY